MDAAELQDPIVEREVRRDSAGVPLFEPRPGGPAERFVGIVGDRHPIVAFFLALISGYLLLAAASIALGFLGVLANKVTSVPLWGVIVLGAAMMVTSCVEALRGNGNA